jgi:hypothetical protein
MLVGLRLQALLEGAKSELRLQELVHPVRHKLVDLPDLVSERLSRACHRACDVTTGLLTGSNDDRTDRMENTIK